MTAPCVERDLLELMMAYGFVPLDAVPGGNPRPLPPGRPSPVRNPARAILRLAVMSAGFQAGRTLVITGLARAWARAGASVLLVDLDPADELARTLLLGSAITVDTGQLLLRAVAGGGIAEPSRTVLPGVDLIGAGGLGGDPEPLVRALAGRPTALRTALAPWLDRYDRLLVDTPTAPAALPTAARAITDAVLALVPANNPAVPLPEDLFGVVLTRFDPARPPAADAVAPLAGAGLLDTAVPELFGLRSPWDLVAGAGTARADAVFSALAAEIDARRGEGGPVPLQLPEADRPTVVDPSRARPRGAVLA
jgi:hypothetical protein